MRVLVLGATGLLGRVLLEEWSPNDDVTGIGSRDVDVRDRSRLHACFARLRPECAVLAAAYTDVDGCERNHKLAHDVNCIGTANVAHECREVGSQLLFVSTDYVFDGCKSVPYDTDDDLNPLSVYGQSKAEAESAVHEVLPHACIARTSWLFGANGRCFPNTILTAARKGRKLSVVDDEIGRPTYNRDLAQAIVKLCTTGAQGIVHASNSGSCSWHQFACQVLRVAGFADVPVETIRTEDLSRPARRPKHSVLSLSSLEAFGIQMRPWQDTIADYIRDRISFNDSCQPAAPMETRTA
jgi:dTDP-4-dehydrorhamnose reductase